MAGGAPDALFAGPREAFGAGFLLGEEEVLAVFLGGMVVQDDDERVDL
jgi:hypothetical protein